MKQSFTVKGFSGGIISPEIQGRYDFNKTQLGLKDAENFTLDVSGTANFRIGTEYVAPCKFHNKVTTTMKFGSSRAAVYCIESGDQYMRFFRNGAAITVAFPITNGNFTTDITGWTDLSSGGGSISHNAVDGRMVIAGATGYASQSVTTVADQDYILSVDVVGNPLKVTIGTTSGGSEIHTKELKVGTGQKVFFKATGVTTYIGFKQDAALTSEIDNVSAVEPYEIASPYLEAEVKAVRYVQNGDDLYMTHPSHPVKKLTRTSDTSWAITDMLFEPADSNVSTLTAAGSGTVVVAFDWYYTVTNVYDDGSESKQFATKVKATGTDVDLTKTPVTVTITPTPSSETGISHYRVYRKGGGDYYLINVIEADGSASYTFKDSGLDADETESPLLPFTEFGSADNYPSCCGVYNQRLVLAGTNNKPDWIWLSRVAEYDNFTKTPALNADESFSKKLSSGVVNKILHIETLDDMIVLTDGKVWRVQGTNNNDFKAFVESSVGTSDVRPVPTRKSMLFVEGNSSTVSDFIFKDSVNGYDGDDLTTLTKPLFRNNTIVSMDFQSSPSNILHAVRDDGTMLVLTYMKNQNVYGWSKLVTAGAYESVVAIDNPVYDVVYTITKRTINGSEKRFIEIFKTEYETTEVTNDSWYVDSGLGYNGSPQTVFTGLDHLAGEEVVVYGDSDVVGRFTVDVDGAVTLPRACSRVIIGLEYSGFVSVISPEFDIKGFGSTMGLSKNVYKCTVSVLNSRGFFHSTDGVKYQQFETTPATDIGVTIPNETKLFTFDVEDSDKNYASMFIAQKEPLPLRVMNITLDINFGKR